MSNVIVPGKQHSYFYFMTYMLNKITIFLLALLHITTFSGLTINMHYCMDEFVEWNFSHNKDQNCSKCGMQESERKGCCEDKQKFLKIDSEQKIADAAFHLHLFTLTPALVNNSIELTSVYVTSLIAEHPISNVPPRSSGIAVYIRNCIFLI